jgi:hypothetical protein
VSYPDYLLSSLVRLPVTRSPGIRLHNIDRVNRVRLNRNGLAPAPSRKIYTAKNNAYEIRSVIRIFPTPFLRKENVSFLEMISSPRKRLLRKI